MGRNPGTDRQGNHFSEHIKLLVWNKAQIVPGVDAAKRRKDTCGAWIDWSQYGVTQDKGSGWEIDHIKPVAKGGGDELSNLQPLQWQNNRHKSDNYPASGYCIISGRQ